MKGQLCLLSIAATVSSVFFVRARSSSYSETSFCWISNETFLAVPSNSSRVGAEAMMMWLTLLE